MKTDKLLTALDAVASRIEQEKDFLTQLDNDIADGDHGINMARGFAAVKKMIPTWSEKSIADVLRGVGMQLVSTVGGAAGPLYGTAFMRAGAAMTGKEEIDAAGAAECLQAAIEGVMQRGKAVRGEKTMLDSMIPALEAMQQALNGGADAKAMLKAGVDAAYEGIEFTKTIAATKGRASYIGERSIGHQDPGATSFTYILEEFRKSV